MRSYTYILIALAIIGQVRAADEAAGAPEPYAYGYEAPDHAAAEERKPDGSVSGYYTLKDADGRSRRVNYVADESGFHANVETNEHGTKTSNPADAQIMAAPATPEQLVYQQRVQYQAAPLQQQQQTSFQQVVPQFQKLQNQIQESKYNYEVPVNYYGYNPGNSNSAVYGYGYYPQLNNGYYTTTNSAYYPNSAVYGAYNNNGYSTSYGSPVSYQGLSSSSYGVGDGSVYGGYNYHTPGSYLSAVRSTAGGQQVVGKPVVSGYNYVRTSVVPASQSVYRSVSSSSSAQPIVGSSNYSVIQKRDVEASKAAQPSQNEKASPEKPGKGEKAISIV